VNTRHPAVIAAAAILGVICIALAIVYWAEPAGSLPSLLPGHEAGSAHHHVKHGIAAFLLGVVLLIFAWFQSGGDRRKRSSAT
jgi:ammonia channel protein AmtB